MKRKSFLIYFCLISLFLSSVMAPKAKAITLGEAALLVAISSGTGAILGASTLPFYGEPDLHKKNIFYGASLGAVVGVLLSAYSGFEESSKEELDARNQRWLNPETTSVIAYKPKTMMQAEPILVYAPATILRF